MKKLFAKTHIVLAVALVLILLGSIFGGMVHTSFYSVDISEIEFQTERGTLNGLLYMPKGAGANDQRPVVITTHGYLNTKEMQDAPAIEMSRRGYIVLALDMYDHGDSRWDGDIPVGGQFSTFWLYSMSDAANYIAQQPYTAKDADGNAYVSVSGHSMGGFSSLVALYLDEMASLQTGVRNIYAGIAVGADFSYAAAIAPQSAYEAAFGSRTVGIIGGHYDEFFFNKSADEKTPEEAKVQGTVTYKDFCATNSGKSFLGLSPEDPAAEAGKYYTVEAPEVTVEDTVVRGAETGTRVIYTPNQTHPWNHFSAEATSDLITFYQTAFDGVTSPNQANANLDPNNQVWQWKEFFNMIALIGFFLLILPLAELLLKLPFLKKAITEKTAPVAAATSSGGKALYWMTIVFSAMIPAILFPTLMDKQDANIGALLTTACLLVVFGIIAAAFGARDKNKNVMHGGIAVAVVSLVGALVFGFAENILALSPYFVEPTVNQIGYWAVVSGLIALLITVAYYYFNKKEAGTTFASYGVSLKPVAIAASLVVALVIVAVGYGLLYLMQALFGVDFRIWTLAVRTFKPEHLIVTLRYAPFFLFYYFINTVALNANTRGRKMGYLISILLNVGGLILWVVAQYGLDFITGVGMCPGQALNGILLFALIPCLAIAAVYARKLYEKTNNVWLAAFLNTTLFTLITCANTALFWNMVPA